MVQTALNLDPEDENWLETLARERNVTTTELVRDAVRRMREELEKGDARPSFGELLALTAGIWKRGEGLEYQRAIRDEWDRNG